MADIDRVIDITITRQTTVPAVATFNDFMIAAEFLAADPTNPFAADERVRLYGDLAEILADFGSLSDVYWAAAAALSQNPSVNQLYVGRKLTGVDGTETWTVALAAMNVYNSAWYGLIPNTRTLADQQEAADWRRCRHTGADLVRTDARIQ